MATNQQWIDGAFTESDTDYKINDINILYKNEEDYLVKGVELLCDKLNPSSVLEFGFGKGWTATEFQRKGVTRHLILEPNKESYQMALTWKNNYTTNIEILNIFSWDYDGGETFDLVYDDREPFKNDDDDVHFAKMKTILPKDQWYAFNCDIGCDNSTPVDYNHSIPFDLGGVKYSQFLTKGYFGNY